ncbi:hypothetical protein V8G54_021650 [Vigna mungo]|uniref:Uncharacterized protein n=1 Tax=Vigna mungo TaxID=3915 RepID=A0AAQ3RUH3_VIGMU
MEPLSRRLFTLTVLLAVLFSAASNAVNESEITKHKATESRYLGQRNASSFCLHPGFIYYEDVVEEEKLRGQSLKNSSMAERLVLLRFIHEMMDLGELNQSEPLINSVKEFTWLSFKRCRFSVLRFVELADGLNEHAIDNPEEIASMVDE